MKTLLLLLSLWAIIGCSPEEEQHVTGTRVVAGEQVPTFGLNDVTGCYPFDTRTAFPGDRAVMIYLLMSSCPDCRAQGPAVVELWRDYVAPSFQMGAREHYQLICIARGDDKNTPAKAEEYWQELAAQMGVAREDMPPLYYDDKRQVYNKFANSGVPRFYAVSPAGIITWEALTEQEPLTAAALAGKLHEAYRQ